VADPKPEPVAPRSIVAALPRIEAIDERSREADGFSSLGDAARRALAHREPETGALLVDDLAFGCAWPTRPAAVDRRWEIAVTLTPEARPTGLRSALVTDLLDHVARRGGGRVTWWVPGASDATDADARRAGLAPNRDLLRLEAPLPLAVAADTPADASFRSFVPGADDRAWLALNNAAFAGHPEQGNWTEAMLSDRCAEPWFDPLLFVLAEDHGSLVGANWVRRHPGAEAEIYVISVDRSHRGTGLGRALATAGLAAAAASGSTRASLYCAADNAPARRLYSSLGFTVVRIDRAYETEVTPR